MPKVVAIGEVMVEFAREPDGRYGLAAGGDTFNTAVYLAREGVPTAYATALGDDTYSDRILALAEAEGLDISTVRRVAGRMPGLYVIETDPNGERRFHYWRDNAPARELFDRDDWTVLATSLVGADIVYLSGITLSLYSNVGLGRLFAFMEMVRGRGGRVAFDTNYRPRGWGHDPVRARTVFGEALRRVDIVLPSFDDEALLWGDASPEVTIARLSAYGIGEIVVKRGAEPVMAYAPGATYEVAVPQVLEPVDTTAAGDSFAAGYIASRLGGVPMVAAVEAGHRLAARVCMHRGAIMPREAPVH